MRILFSANPAAFDCPGGGEIMLLKSLEALERAGAEVIRFDPWRPRLDEVDVVHYFSIQGGPFFCDYVTRRGLPLVISPILWLTQENRRQFPMQEICDILHLAEVVLPNSEAEKEQLAEAFHLARDRFAVVHNAVDGVFAQPADPRLFRDRFGIRGPFLLNVANAEQRKNQLRLIRAVRGLDIRLVVAGNLRDREYWDACRKEGADFVQHVGALDHGGELMRSAYAACDAFVLPSLLETPGLAALEAAASGARVLVTREGSAREYFGDHVAYVDPLDVDDIRNGIRRALASTPSPALRARIVSDFTWDRVARQLLDAYERAANARKAARSQR